MPWIKDTHSQKPKTVYLAPVEVFPIVKVVYDPKAVEKWSVVYAWLQGPSDSQASIEAVIGV